MRIPRWLVVVCLVGCNRAAPPAPHGQNSAEPGPVKVKVVTAKTQPMQWVIEQPGIVEPLEVTALVAKLPGYVRLIAPDVAAIKAGVKLPGGQEAVIDIGSEVAAGQLLATLDIPELDAEAIEKDAAVKRATNEKVLAEKDVEVAKSQVVAAEALVKEAEAGSTRADADVVRWKAELDQANEQFKGGVADKQTLNVVTKNWESAKAAKAEAEARVTTARAMVKERTSRQGRAEADVAAAAAKVEVAEAEAARLKKLLEYKEITAPFAGIVTARNVNTRTFIQPATASQNHSLFTVARVDVLRVFADIPEASAEKAAVGAAAVVRVPALAGREYPATVTRTSRVVSPDSRTLRIEIDIENKDRAVSPGMYVVVQIKASAAEAQVLPLGCVLAADETHYVFLLEGGKAVKYRVQLGRSDAGNVQVFGRRLATKTSGPWEPFTGSEQVVNGNLGALTDGAAVTPQ